MTAQPPKIISQLALGNRPSSALIPTSSGVGSTAGYSSAGTPPVSPIKPRPISGHFSPVVPRESFASSAEGSGSSGGDEGKVDQKREKKEEEKVAAKVAWVVGARALNLGSSRESSSEIFDNSVIGEALALTSATDASVPADQPVGESGVISGSNEHSVVRTEPGASGSVVVNDRSGRALSAAAAIDEEEAGSLAALFNRGGSSEYEYLKVMTNRSYEKEASGGATMARSSQDAGKSGLARGLAESGAASGGGDRAIMRGPRSDSVSTPPATLDALRSHRPTMSSLRQGAPSSTPPVAPAVPAAAHKPLTAQSSVVPLTQPADLTLAGKDSRVEGMVKRADARAMTQAAAAKAIMQCDTAKRRAAHSAKAALDAALKAEALQRAATAAAAAATATVDSGGQATVTTAVPAVASLALSAGENSSEDESPRVEPGLGMSGEESTTVGLDPSVRKKETGMEESRERSKLVARGAKATDTAADVPLPATTVAAAVPLRPAPKEATDEGMLEDARGSLSAALDTNAATTVVAVPSANIEETPSAEAAAADVTPSMSEVSKPIVYPLSPVSGANAGVVGRPDLEYPGALTADAASPAPGPAIAAKEESSTILPTSGYGEGQQQHQRQSEVVLAGAGTTSLAEPPNVPVAKVVMWPIAGETADTHAADAVALRPESETGAATKTPTTMRAVKEEAAMTAESPPPVVAGAEMKALLSSPTSPYLPLTPPRPESNFVDGLQGARSPVLMPRAGMRTLLRPASACARSSTPGDYANAGSSSGPYRMGLSGSRAFGAGLGLAVKTDVSDGGDWEREARCSTCLFFFEFLCISAYFFIWSFCIVVD